LRPACATLSTVASIIILLVSVLPLDSPPLESPSSKLRGRSLFLGHQSFSLSDGGGEGTAFSANASVDNEATVFFGANGFSVVVVAVVAELFYEAKDSWAVVVVMTIFPSRITYLPLCTSSSVTSRSWTSVLVAGTPALRARPYSPEGFNFQVVVAGSLGGLVLREHFHPGAIFVHRYVLCREADLARHGCDSLFLEGS
jgi:hypothetical protein